MEFDSAGRVMASWGGPGLGFVWPQSTGGIAVDGDGNVWVAAYGLEPAPAGRGRGAADPDAVSPPPAARGGADGAAAGGRGRGRGDAAGGAAPAAAAPAAAQAPPARGRGAAPAAAPAAADAHITKYSPAGQQLLRIGTPGQPGGPDSQTGLNRPAGMAIDDAAHEVYVADSGNHRVAVFDSNTGAFKRSWGGSGDRPTAAGGGPYDPNAAPSRQFRDVTCVKVAKDGMVYVCDRTSNRIQVFQKNGTFVKEFAIRPETHGTGSSYDLAFWPDRNQTYLIIADGADGEAVIVRRSDGVEVGAFGHYGKQVGQFHNIHQIVSDSKGNIYTGEVDVGMRIQKFTPNMAPAK
jgi:DNA-binding beta-propeller fold protein YncE